MRFVRLRAERATGENTCVLFHATSPKPEIMKKSKHTTGSSKKIVKTEPKAKKEDKPLIKLDSLDDVNDGFGSWLRSSDGLDNMKLFVIANSIVILTTMVYPHIHIVFQIISDAFYGLDGIF